MSHDHPHHDDDDALPTDAVLVRDLREGDLAAIVRIDKHSTGRSRHDYYQGKVRAALGEQKLKTSLVAEIDGIVVGFLLAHVYYGEFGRAEATAVVDSMGVDPKFRGRHVGAAMMRQMLMNLEALRVERVETQAGWDQFDLLAFLAKAGFRPVARLVLERPLGSG